MADELFEVRNLFTLGNYQGAINAATKLKPSNGPRPRARAFSLLFLFCFSKKKGPSLTRPHAQSVSR
jgi:hypothetical protein